MPVAQHRGLTGELIWACINAKNFKYVCQDMQLDLGGLCQNNSLPPLDLSSFCTLLMLQGQQEFPIPAYAENTPSSPDVFCSGCFIIRSSAWKIYGCISHLFNYNMLMKHAFVSGSPELPSAVTDMGPSTGCCLFNWVATELVYLNHTHGLDVFYITHINEQQKVCLKCDLLVTTCEASP